VYWIHEAQGAVTGAYEHGNESPGSIKGDEFF
jgi:hypothetical protein